MSNINHLLNTRRWVYYLDPMQPHPQDKNLFRVSIVFEDESGHFPTGAGDVHKEPWYWDEATCKRKNAERGFSEVSTFEIIASSMRVSRI